MQPSALQELEPRNLTFGERHAVCRDRSIAIEDHQTRLGGCLGECHGGLTQSYRRQAD